MHGGKSPRNRLPVRKHYPATVSWVRIKTPAIRGLHRLHSLRCRCTTTEAFHEPWPPHRRAVTRLRPQAKSLIVTIYGDSLTPHGGSAWLGSLIRLTEPLGLNERTVRTSVFRLAKEGWLIADQIGRRSYYRLTETGWHRCEAAHGRIFFPPRQNWDERWTLVSLGHASIDSDNWQAAC